ncbi:MAG: hypothetical protein H7A45_04375 [Verrucomicrobiales bacterium]|nr:hypothetical protein [Verrucomicrobiales bacterium]MCP5528423.1 hypothetical protein [Verrucomicrobiales bacterium]
MAGLVALGTAGGSEATLTPDAVRFVLRPVADQSGEDDEGDGVFDRLGNPNSLYLEVRRGQGRPARVSSALEFKLPDLANDMTVKSAELGLYATEWTYINRCSIRGYKGDGVIALTDLAAGSYLTSLAFAGMPAQRKHARVTEFVRMVAEEGKAYVGFQLREGTGVPWANGSVTFRSSDGGNAPTLEIQLGLRPLTAGLVAAEDGTTRLRLSFRSAAGHRYTIQSSTDLTGWTTLRSGIPGSGQTIILDDLPVLPVQRVFHRLVLEQP